MMNFLNRSGFVCIVACSLAAGVAAQERGTKEEARAMVNAAVAHVKKVGPQKAFDDFTNDKATWVKKDLYVFAYNYAGTVQGIGSNPKLVGKNLIDIKDGSGRYLIKDLGEVAKKGGGWYDYDWADPVTKKIAPKSSYAVQVPGFDGFLGVGVYR